MSKRRSLSMKDQKAGSHRSGEPAFLAVGQLRRPHGVRGEILMAVWTDFPERLVPGLKVYVGDDQKPVHIRSVRWHRDHLLISFDEYPFREDVGILRNEVVLVRSEGLPPLGEGELYLHQVLGMTVIDDSNNKSLGTVTEIIETGANDVYIVRNEDSLEILLPALDHVILDINVDTNEMRVHLLPGLLPEMD
jgi:16S rRNA processing protein RimM